MTAPHDDEHEMQDEPVLDERAVQEILDGSDGGSHLGLQRMVDSLRSVTSVAPPPAPELAALFAQRISPEPDGDRVARVAHRRSLVMRVRSMIAGLSIAGKLALGAGVAAAATTGAGAAGALPDPVQRTFAQVVNPVTPFDVYEPTPVAALPAAARIATPQQDTGGPSPETVAPPSTVVDVAPGDNAQNAAAPATSVPAPEPSPVAEPPAEMAPKPEAPTPSERVAPTKAPSTQETPPVDTSTTKAPTTTKAPAPTTSKPPSTTTTVPVTHTLSCTQGATGTAVTCRWTSTRPSDAVKWLLVRSGPDGIKTVLETRDAAVTTFVDQGTVVTKTYTYSLKAKNAAGQQVGRSESVKVTVVAR